ncbi:hypothetical protein AMATHDRAFT_72113, partial [Amanita thiersii Skay4041]
MKYSQYRKHRDPQGACTRLRYARMTEVISEHVVQTSSAASESANEPIQRCLPYYGKRRKKKGLLSKCHGSATYQIQM